MKKVSILFLCLLLTAFVLPSFLFLEAKEYECKKKLDVFCLSKDGLMVKSLVKVQLDCQKTNSLNVDSIIRAIVRSELSNYEKSELVKSFRLKPKRKQKRILKKSGVIEVMIIPPQPPKQ